MTSLQDWAMLLAGIAVFGSLCEVILPEGSFQKYIRLGLGMILVLSLLSPMRGVRFREWDWEDKKSENAETQRTEMKERQREEILRIYQGNLDHTMLASIQARLPEFSGSVRCSVEAHPEEFGAIREVVIVSEKEVNEDEVQKILTEEFGISAEQMIFRR